MFIVKFFLLIFNKSVCNWETTYLLKHSTEWTERWWWQGLLLLWPGSWDCSNSDESIKGSFCVNSEVKHLNIMLGSNKFI